MLKIFSAFFSSGINSTFYTLITSFLRFTILVVNLLVGGIGFMLKIIHL